MDNFKTICLALSLLLLIPGCVDPKQDTDEDGMIDTWESANGLDPTDPNDADLDKDSDGLTNKQEYQYQSNPNSVDSDGDGLEDGDEVYIHGTHPARSDTDYDGLDDPTELNGVTSAINPDTDGDGLKDGDEFSMGTDPLNPDSDGDTISDGKEVHTYGSDPLSLDSDEDGLSDSDEVNIYGTHPANSDTDGDMLSDPDELNIYGTSPLAADTDGDGVIDSEELNIYDTDPLDYADKPPNAPVTWWFESFEKTTMPEGFTLPIGVSTGWEVVSGDSSSGRKSLRTQATNVGQTAAIEYRANFVDGALKFDYRVVRESNVDKFKVFVDAVQVGLVDRETLVWQTKTINIAAGFHTIKWVFENEGNYPYGYDHVWIDNIRFKVSNLYADYDNDQIPDYWEAQYGLNRLNPANQLVDDDGDGLTTLAEYQARTDPLVIDTDGDGLEDGDELTIYNTNPIKKDSDSDGLTDYEELNTHLTNPSLIDSDADNFSDGFELLTGSNPLINAQIPSIAESYYVSFPERVDTADWNMFNRMNGWIREPYSGYTMGAAPLGYSQITEWTRQFTEGSISFNYVVIKKLIGYEYTFKIYLDGVEVAEVLPGYASKIEVQWKTGTTTFNVPAGEHTIRWEIQLPKAVWRYEVGVYLYNIMFQGAIP